MLAGVIYVATSTVVTGFCCDRDKQSKGRGREGEIQKQNDICQKIKKNW